MDEIIKNHYIDNFQKQLSNALKLCDLSTDDVVERLDITRQTLNNWEASRGKFTLINAVAVSSLLDFMTVWDKEKRSELLSWYSISSNTMFQYATGTPDPQSLTEAWHQKFLSPNKKIIYDEILLGRDRLSDYKILLDIYSLATVPMQLFIDRLGKPSTNQPLILYICNKNIKDQQSTVSKEQKITMLTVLEMLADEKDKISLKEWVADSKSDNIVDIIKMNSGSEKTMLFTSDNSKAVQSLDAHINVGFLDSDGSLIDIKSFSEGIAFLKNPKNKGITISSKIVQVEASINDILDSISLGKDG